jgi:hypothetical protein
VESQKPKESYSLQKETLTGPPQSLSHHMTALSRLTPYEQALLEQWEPCILKVAGKCGTSAQPSKDSPHSSKTLSLEPDGDDKDTNETVLSNMAQITLFL